MNASHDTTAEWIETDGRGGFAMGTPSGVRTRRYHGILLTATTPPTGRLMLVNAVEAWLETPGGSRALTTHHYAPDAMHPDGRERLASFEAAPWPRWRYDVNDGVSVRHELIARRGRPQVVLTWELSKPVAGARLHVRPLLSARDYHALHHENAAFRFDAAVAGERVAWRPYGSLPGIVARSNGAYGHAPEWFRNFLYSEERARGLDHVEDLASPGVFTFDLAAGPAVLVFEAQGAEDEGPNPENLSAVGIAEATRRERRRETFASPLDRAAGAYLVRRGGGATIVAGYPWFTDWGRDTFIAIRGLCFATERWLEAKEILLEWAGTVSEGMLPNRFPDRGEGPEYNSVDASLWYVIAVHEFLTAVERGDARCGPDDTRALARAIDQILTGYARGTRFGIGADDDGLLRAGAPGLQLTWMDAKVGDWVVTPRVGKPVEVQALWVNALWAAYLLDDRWDPAYRKALASFQSRFWNAEGRSLYDVVDCDGIPGTVDASFRPNQVLAVGGLPLSLLPSDQARSVVDAVEARLWTPLGLRTLAPDDARYRGRYEGGVAARDGAYHQGTAWPWLLGPFVEAWVRVRGATPEVRKLARDRFLAPLIEGLRNLSFGHVCEIADGDAPHAPRGCPCQAWSVGEALRLDRVVLGAPEGER
ncbi:MAG: glycogen debranching enzyme family protein [Myxococcales bacterium]|nr:glycogen debranching enzyme family protein [Myxococcales bacterium]